MKGKDSKKDARADVWYDVRVMVYFRDQQKPLVIEYAHKANADFYYWSFFKTSPEREMCRIEGYRKTHVIAADVIRRMTLETKRSDKKDEQPDHRPKEKKK